MVQLASFSVQMPLADECTPYSHRLVEVRGGALNETLLALVPTLPDPSDSVPGSDLRSWSMYRVVVKALAEMHGVSVSGDVELIIPGTWGTKWFNLRNILLEEET